MFSLFHSRWRFFWFHKDREITKNLFISAESNFGEKKTFVHSLELWRNFICGNETGSLGRAVSLHLARSGSQSEHRICCILPACGACHIIITSYYMANPVLGKSLCSDWFFLGQDFVVRTVSMETVLPWKRSDPCIFVLERGRQIQNLHPKQQKKVWKMSFFTLKLSEEAKKIEIFPKFQR